MDRKSGDSLRLSPVSLVNALLIALAVPVLGIALLAGAVPMTGRMTFVVAGPSMEPALSVGSAIIVEPVDPAALAVGDVVSIRSGPAAAVFTHRIVRLAQRDGAPWLETKGDANESSDPSIVPVQHVLGRVQAVIPYAGYLLVLPSRPSGLITVVAVGMLLLVAAGVLDPRRAMSPDRQPA